MSFLFFAFFFSLMVRNILSFVRTHKWKTLIGFLVVLPLVGLTALALQPTPPEYITAVAERGELRQTVEAVGTVISERDLNLQFPISGVVADVLVKEGDRVTAGQALARLRAGNIAADISAASGRVRAAEAELQRLLEGARTEDIAITRAEVENRRASLEAAKSSLQTAQTSADQSRLKLAALRQELDTSLAGTIGSVGSTVTQELTDAENVLVSIQRVFSDTDVVDAVIKFDPSRHQQLESLRQRVSGDIRALYGQTNPANATDALALLARAKTLIGSTNTVVNEAFSLINALPENAYFTEAERQTHSSTLATDRSTVQSSLSTIDTTSNALRDASANIDTRIATEEATLSSAEGAAQKAQADIATFEASLRIAQAQLQLKEAPPRQADINAAQASLQQARAAWQRAQADYANTVITAPSDGLVTKVNVKTGEISPVGPAVTMLGNSPYRIEMFASEIDIPKIRLTQTGSIELDAFPGVNFALRVSEVDPAATDRDGVTKYRVRLDFVYPHEELKIGMTGDAEILTDVRKDVVHIPLRAILENDEGGEYVRVMKKDGTIEERTVVVGMEGGNGNAEVEGIEEGETVVVLERS